MLPEHYFPYGCVVIGYAVASRTSPALAMLQPVCRMCVLSAVDANAGTAQQEERAVGRRGLQAWSRELSAPYLCSGIIAATQMRSKS